MSEPRDTPTLQRYAPEMSKRDDLSHSDLTQLDKAHLWRPYTASEEHEAMDPIWVKQAEGATIVGSDGRRYLDGHASWWTKNLGHRHPRLMRALRDQAERFEHVAMAGMTHEPGALLAKELVDVAPKGLERVFFSDDGSTSVEVALKMAVQRYQQRGETQRRRFISLAGAYHGDTVGVMSIGDLAEFRGVFAPVLFDVIRAPLPSTGEEGWAQCVAEIERVLETEGDTIAGVVVEPLLQGAAGMRLWQPALLRRLRQATTQAGTLLIADEVFTGFGRTGTMFACEQAGISPDILCTAKGLSGGVLPFAATLATGAVYDDFRGGKARSFMHGHTFYGNPLGAAIAREVLAVYREEDVLAGVQKRAKRFEQVAAELSEIEGVLRPRSLGMMVACDLGEGDGYYGKVGAAVQAKALEHGVLIRPLGDVVYLTPPLNIDESELDTVCEVFVESVRQTAQS